MAQSLDASAGGAAVFALAAAFGSLASALAFAGVFAFAAVITWYCNRPVLYNRSDLCKRVGLFRGQPGCGGKNQLRRKR